MKKKIESSESKKMFQISEEALQKRRENEKKKLEENRKLGLQKKLGIVSKKKHLTDKLKTT